MAFTPPPPPKNFIKFSKLPPSLHNALFSLFLGGILAYGAGFAWYMLARFDLINLIRDVNTDDAFYYYQIAFNLAEGKFSTFDGGITQTNGYHPLWLFLITPFYWIFDKEAALFGIKAFEIMLVAGGVALVAVAARLARLPWVLLFAALPMLYQQRTLLLGLEAAAALFMLGLFFLAVMLYVRDSQRWRWPLAAVAFSLPWVRLEYIAISLAVTAVLGLIEWSRRERPPGASLRAAIISTPPRTFVPIIGAVAGLLVYFAYNGLVFGGVTPVSGATKQMWSQAWWDNQGGYSFVQNFRDVLQIRVFDYELLVALEVCAYVVLVWWFARRSKNRKDWLLLAFLVCVFGLAAGHLAKFAQTVLTVHPFWGRYTWYFVPAYLLMTLIIPVRCYVAIHFIRRFIRPRSPRAANIVSAGIVVVGAAFLLTKADFTEPFQLVDRLSESTGHNYDVASYMGVRVMDRVLPGDSVVGSWDAGVIGYFSRFPVVNVDGLVNSYDFYRARNRYPYWQARKEVTEDAFYQNYGITRFANVTGGDLNVKRGFALDNVMFEGALYPEPNASGLRFKLWSYSPTRDAADWFWQRMEPHFDYQSDNVGVIVDGRMAQAFVRDCAPDELTVWSWVGQGDETAVSPWTQTQAGLCTASLVLPRNARPPVRAETMPMGDYLAELVGDRRPVIRSDWDVYLVENSLIYVKEPCASADTEARFFLHLYPVDGNDLPGRRRQYGFDNLDFDFGWRGMVLDGRCMARIPLPEYAIARIDTGQFVHVDGGSHNLWEVGMRLDDGVALIVNAKESKKSLEAALRSDYETLVSGEPVIRSDFDIYLSENKLTYVKEPCVRADTEAVFFLHLHPVDGNDLPDRRKQHGFANLDFDFDERGVIFDGRCMAGIPLPEYAIARIDTGQFVHVDGGYNHVWEGSFDVVEPADDGKAAQ